MRQARKPGRGLHELVRGAEPRGYRFICLEGNFPVSRLEKISNVAVIVAAILVIGNNLCSRSW
jgi:hypothetical protein